MIVSPGPHTLHQTIGGTTTVTVPFDETGFTAWGRRWTYNPGNDHYESGDDWLAFSGGTPKVFAGMFGGQVVGGWWE